LFRIEKEEEKKNAELLFNGIISKIKKKIFIFTLIRHLFQRKKKKKAKLISHFSHLFSKKFK